MDQLNEDFKVYKMLDSYRMELGTAALTIHDVRKFIERNPSYRSEAETVLMYIVLGNACSWGSYEFACCHHETYRDALHSLLEGILDKVR